MTKRKVGRPTEYAGEKSCLAVHVFTDEMSVQNFNAHCSVAHLACLLGVVERTVYRWAEAHDEFSQAVKRWETKRNALLYEVRGMSDARWIFSAKNWAGMRDKQEVEQTTNVTIRVHWGKPPVKADA
jgi:hypothetical protein